MCDTQQNQPENVQINPERMPITVCGMRKRYIKKYNSFPVLNTVVGNSEWR